jgi:poly-gamma-glutamate synthesis protein (capsule biosynthesis protein)
MRISFLGDFMLSGDQAGMPVSVSRRLKRKLDAFDFRVATLETAVGTYADIDEIKMPKSEVAVWSKPEDLHKLLDLNINVVSLANNHACDCGVDSMLRLLDTLRNLGVTPIGGGLNLEEAMKPAVVEKDGESLAIIGCCEDNPDSLGTLHFATDTEGGIYRLDEKVIVPQIQELKRHYNYVAVGIHWGMEHK